MAERVAPQLPTDLVAAVERAAATWPDRPAWTFEAADGSTTRLTFAEVAERTAAYAAGLRSLGVGPGDRVAVMVGNEPGFPLTWLALARLGAAVVPLNVRYRSADAQHLVDDAGVRLAVTTADHRTVLEGLERPPRVALLHDLDEPAAAYEQGPVDREAVVNVQYTSGTTGKPKGAMLSHRNVCSNAQYTGDFLQFLQTDTVVAVLPMFHVFCMTVCLNAPIYRGATLLVLPRFSPTETSKAILAAKATVFAGVPTMYNYLLQHPECEPSDLQSLRLAISGGAAMPVAVLKAFEQKFNVMVSEGYGLSEASPVVTFNPLDRERKPGTIGVSIPSVEVRVVGEDGRECGPGEVGELICRGPNVMLGYLNKPEETALALRDGWLYTGDLVTIDEEGYVTVVDRKKDMIIVGGFNVYPREVEEVLFKHPAVAEAAVVGIPDMNRGEAVKAFVALKQENGVSAEDLIAFCKENLAPYKVPAEIDVLAELPKNSTGKILRRELKKGNEPKISQ